MAGLRADGDHFRARHELARFSECELELIRLDGVGLRHGDHPALDSEQAEDREVLVRLRSRALACVDDEQEEVDAGCAGDHRSDEPLVSRDVHEREPAAVR